MARKALEGHRSDYLVLVDSRVAVGKKKAPKGLNYFLRIIFRSRAIVA
jgi:hypothetical protein